MNWQDNSGFLITTPIVGASFITLSLFFLIAFSANAILSSATLRTLGIIISLSILGFAFLIIIILFFL